MATRQCENEKININNNRSNFQALMLGRLIIVRLQFLKKISNPYLFPNRLGFLEIFLMFVLTLVLCFLQQRLVAIWGIFSFCTECYALRQNVNSPAIEWNNYNNPLKKEQGIISHSRSSTEYP